MPVPDEPHAPNHPITEFNFYAFMPIILANHLRK